MKSPTSKVVTVFDVSVVVLAIATGVYCGLVGLKSTQELNKRLRKIDNSLGAYSNLKRDRWRALIMLITSLGIITLLLGLDICTWVRLAAEMRVDDYDTEVNVHWYIPFYGMYLILTGLHINFANTVYGIGRRYRRLNIRLKNNFLVDSKDGQPPKKFRVQTVSFNPEMRAPLSMPSSLSKLQIEILPGETAAKNKRLIIKTLAENHDSLCRCVLLVSNTYGIVVLFILVSCLLHLVATAYFLFLELLSMKNKGYLWVQVLWIIFHFSRLLMVVEPCHLSARESRKTIQIVSEIERKVSESILADEVRKFWQQLLVVDADFSAKGLCRIDRTILTSFASAIATYLVILIQLQQTNG